jgi:hypothetical protein
MHVLDQPQQSLLRVLLVLQFCVDFRGVIAASRTDTHAYESTICLLYHQVLAD